MLFNTLLANARSGALDGTLLANGAFYQTDYTQPLLFLSERALPDKASREHLAGNQWGMMNEPGPYPGQAWLWLYTLWYQVRAAPFNGPNADVAVAVVIFVLTLILLLIPVILLLIPVIPGLKRLPRSLGLHRVIWRDYYREMERGKAVEEPEGDTDTGPAVHI